MKPKEKDTNKKQLLFSLTAKDFEIQTFCAGGNGGQHQNKTESAVRIIHTASGAVAESREHKSQLQNRKAAFHRLVGTEKFRKWHSLECSKRMGTIIDVEETVNQQMQPKNLIIETKDSETGKWVAVE